MYNEDSKLNKALKMAMIQHDINNNMLAAKLGKSKQSISNLLNQDNYTLNTLNNLLDAIGYDLKIVLVDRGCKKDIEID